MSVRLRLTKFVTAKPARPPSLPAPGPSPQNFLHKFCFTLRAARRAPPWHGSCFRNGDRSRARAARSLRRWPTARVIVFTQPNFLKEHRESNATEKRPERLLADRTADRRRDYRHHRRHRHPQPPRFPPRRQRGLGHLHPPQHLKRRRSEQHTPQLQPLPQLVCPLLLQTR